MKVPKLGKTDKLEFKVVRVRSRWYGREIMIKPSNEKRILSLAKDSLLRVRVLYFIRKWRSYIFYFGWLREPIQVLKFDFCFQKSASSALTKSVCCLKPRVLCNSYVEPLVCNERDSTVKDTWWLPETVVSLSSIVTLTDFEFNEKLQWKTRFWNLIIIYTRFRNIFVLLSSIPSYGMRSERRL